MDRTRDVVAREASALAALRASAYYNYLGGYIDSPGIKTTANGSIQPDPTTAQVAPNRCSTPHSRADCRHGACRHPRPSR